MDTASLTPAQHAALNSIAARYGYDGSWETLDTGARQLITRVWELESWIEDAWGTPLSELGL